MSYTKHFNTKKTLQTQPVPGRNQIKNNAGGYGFQITPQQQLLRFLILGSEGGSYYVGEQKLTVENANNVLTCIKEDGLNTVQTSVDVSVSGRAAKNDPALFALALCVSFGDATTKAAGYNAIHKVARIGTHLFTFMQYVKDLRGFSRGLRRGINQFYLGRTNDQLALQLVKYRQRNGWTHRDVLRLTHPVATNQTQNDLFSFATGHTPTVDGVRLIEGFQLAQTENNIVKLIQIITDYKLPREAIPTEHLNNPAVQAALVPHMPITATMRNLANFTRSGLVSSNFDETTKLIQSKLTNQEAIVKGRLHPFNVLNALATYQSGGFGRYGRSQGATYNPVQGIVDALDDAFYMSFDAVEPANKNTLLAIDVSGSMSSPIMNSNISCGAGAAAMAMSTVRSEPYTETLYFSSENSRGWMSRSNSLGRLSISKKMRLDSVLGEMSNRNWGGTDCALPMIHAKNNKLDIDTFVIYTDNDTWAGNIHPYQALNDYRQSSGRDAKLVVVGMIASNFTIADPNDAGMLDVVGFDSSAPGIISNFSAGKL